MGWGTEAALVSVLSDEIKMVLTGGELGFPWIDE